MPRSQEFILTLACRDTTGIVYAVSGLLYQAGCNIIDSQQFGDVQGEDATGLFFMRVHFAAPPHLADAAMLDSLTSTLNRAGFMIQAQRLAEECVARQLRCSVIVMDLDEFKAVNDVFGHDAGDRLLTEFACVARSNLRGGDLLARIGGEEFCIVLPSATLREAEEVARNILEVCRADAARCSGTDIPISISIGVAQCSFFCFRFGSAPGVHG